LLAIISILTSYVTVDGQDVGDVLIAENLAHPLMCGFLPAAAAAVSAFA
jgi:hypothetical protein